LFHSTDQYWNEIPRSLPDRLKDETAEKQNRQTDVAKKESLVKPIVLKVKEESFEVQTSKSFGEKLQTDLADPNAIDESLIPSPSVIDSTYHKKADVEVEQSILDRQMQKKALEDRGSNMDMQSFISKSESRRSKIKSARTSRTSRAE
jgi:hypothetical protein